MSLDARALAPVLNERVELCLRRLHRDAVLQPPDEIEEVTAAILAIERAEPEGHPDVGAVVHHIGAGRHDANHLAAQAIDLDGLAHHRTSAKRGLPQLVRENDDAWRQRSGLTGHRRRTDDIGFSAGEQPSLRGPHTERIEQMFVNPRRADTQRAIACPSG